jgi:hypothetical protein
MELQLKWRGFDGDDCFSDFHIDVIAQGETKRLDFGPCVIYGLRKTRKFFQDETKEGIDFGTDALYCDLRRVEDGYALTVRFEGSASNQEFLIKHPLVEIDDSFLTEYYDK